MAVVRVVRVAGTRRTVVLVRTAVSQLGFYERVADRRQVRVTTLTNKRFLVSLHAHVLVHVV